MGTILNFPTTLSLLLNNISLVCCFYKFKLPRIFTSQMLKIFSGAFLHCNSWVRFPRELALGICSAATSLAKASAMRITVLPGYIASEKKRLSEI